MDLVPKILPLFAKKLNVTEKECGVKIFLEGVQTLLGTPMTYSNEYNELKITFKECIQNTDDIIEAFEAHTFKK